VSSRALPLWRLVGARIALFAGLAILAQLLIILADYYWNDEELGRLLVEQQTQALAEGLSATPNGIAYHLPDELAELYGPPHSGYYAQIRTISGSVLFSACPELCRTHFLPLELHPPSFWMRTIAPGKPLTLAGGATVQVGAVPVLVEIVSRGDPDGLVNTVLWHEVTDHMIVPMGLMLVLVVGGAMASIASALAPVRRAAIAAETLDPTDTRSHLSVAGMPLEVAQLAGAVNRAFARVGELMQGQKVLTSAIAHEVRTPLAIIKLELERIDDPRARKAEADLDELTQFVSQATALARLEAVDRGSFVPTDLGQMAEQLVEALAPFVYQHGHAIALGTVTPVSVTASPSLLRDAVRNLVENGVKHTPPGTTITLSVGPGRIVMVSDDGGNTPGTHQGGDKDGLGLGLKIVQRIAEVHGGKLHTARTAQGMSFSLQFSDRPE